MSMIPPSADSGGLAGRASSRISGNPSSRSCKRRPTCRPWKSCGEFGERATRGARAHFTPWWPPCGRRRSSPWFVLRVCRENSASTTSDRWGGAPLVCVFDRPKTVALKWRRNGEVTEWNPVFACATLEMGIGVELCWPYRAQEKGAVGELGGFREGILLQGTPLPGPGGSGAATRGVASGGE